MAKVNGGRFFSAAAKPFLNTTLRIVYYVLKLILSQPSRKELKSSQRKTFPVPPLAPNCKVILADEPKAT